MALRFRAAFGALIFACTLLGVAAPIASAAAPYACQESNWTPYQTGVVQSDYVGGVVGKLDVGTNNHCTGTNTYGGYTMSVFLVNHDATSDGTYGIIQGGFSRMETVSSDDFIIGRSTHANECKANWSDGIRYFARIETWNSSHTEIYSDCWDYGAASGNDFKFKIVAADCGFLIYVDANNDGDYTDAGDINGGQLGVSLTYNWLCGGGGYYPGAYLPETFDRGESIGASSNPNDAYELRKEISGSWPDFFLTTSQCFKPSGSSPTMSCTAPISGGNEVQSYGT